MVLEDIGNPDIIQYNQLLENFQQHCEGLRSVQDIDGRWHNILTNSSTYLETSASAMYLTAFITVYLGMQVIVNVMLICLIQLGC